MILRMTPVRIISLCLINPVPKTIAFGGVATGSIKAQDAPIPMTNTNTSCGKPICSALAANTGTSRAAEAVLEANSVKKIINADTAIITTISGAEDNALATVSPRTKDAPDTFKIVDRAIPPPNSMSTPQSVLSDTCFHDTKPKLTTAAAADKAITASVSVISSAAPIFLEKIQLNAVTIKTIIVTTRGLFHTIGSSSTNTILRFRLGFKNTYIAPNNSGNNTSIIGTPNFIQSTKAILSAFAAIAFGGEPTIVPKPPRLAE